MRQRQPVDVASYVAQSQQGPCFICRIVAGDPAYAHHVVYEDETAIAFLNKYPTLYGYVLVAPRAHREQVTGDFTLEECLAHVHWHVAPLPPGVPHRQQQYEALRMENGILEVPEDETSICPYMRL